MEESDSHIRSARLNGKWYLVDLQFWCPYSNKWGYIPFTPVKQTPIRTAPECLFVFQWYYQSDIVRRTHARTRLHTRSHRTPVYLDLLLLCMLYDIVSEIFILCWPFKMLGTIAILCLAGENDDGMSMAMVIGMSIEQKQQRQWRQWKERHIWSISSYRPQSAHARGRTSSVLPGSATTHVYTFVCTRVHGQSSDPMGIFSTQSVSIFVC